MRKLLRLIEVARTQDQINILSIPLPERKQMLDLKHLDRWIETGIKPLVFEPLKGLLEDPAEPPEPTHDEAGIPIINNAPFSIFSIEYIGDTALSVGRYSEVSHAITCLVCIENPLAVSRFSFLCLAVTKGGVERVIYLTQGYEGTVQAILERFYAEQVGSVATRQRVKRVSKGAGKHTIREIIYVSPRKQRTYSSDGRSSPIDYTHRFNVRGHYRRINGLGKDRQGRYVVNGYTWVSEYTKGPENKPLIDKIRLVKGES